MSPFPSATTTSSAGAKASSSSDEAMSLKERGNEAFKKGELDEALDLYTRAIGASYEKDVRAH